MLAGWAAIDYPYLAGRAQDYPPLAIFRQSPLRMTSNRPSGASRWHKPRGPAGGREPDRMNATWETITGGENLLILATPPVTRPRTAVD